MVPVAVRMHQVARLRTSTQCKVEKNATKHCIFCVQCDRKCTLSCRIPEKLQDTFGKPQDMPGELWNIRKRTEHLVSCARGRSQTSISSGGGDFAPGTFRTRKFRTGFISHSGLKIEREISHASRIFSPLHLHTLLGLFCGRLTVTGTINITVTTSLTTTVTVTVATTLSFHICFRTCRNGGRNSRRNRYRNRCSR